MKVRGFIILAFSVWMASCIAISQTSSGAPGREPTAVNPVPNSQASATPAPVSTASEPAPVSSIPPIPPIPPTPSAGSFELVGHTPLLNRGMNAAPTVYGNYAYVGSRTDGSHADAGVLVVDISNPASPTVVYQIGPPEEGLVGQTSRELRVWPEQELLLVLNFYCELRLHDCKEPLAPPNINFYDISGANAAVPRLIAVYPLQRTPHEMFLWDDPQVDGRALLYLSTPGRFGPNLLVMDISQARQGVFQVVGN